MTNLDKESQIFTELETPLIISKIKENTKESGQGIIRFKLDKNSIDIEKSRIIASNYFLACFQILLFKYTQKENIFILDIPLIEVNTTILQTDDFRINIFNSNLNNQKTIKNLIDDNNNIYIEFYLNECINKKINFNIPIFIFKKIDYFIKFNLINFIDNYQKISLFQNNIKLLVLEDNKNYFVNIIYSKDILDTSFIQRMSEHYKNILNQAIKNLQIAISKIKIITFKEKQTILHELNNTISIYPKNKSLQEIYESNVNKYSNKVAIIFKSFSLTYSQLNQISNQLAWYILDINQQKNKVIAIWLTRSLNTIISILAVLKSGNIYLPLQGTYPAERLHQMLQNASVNMVITNKDNNINFEGENLHVIYIEDVLKNLNKYSKENPKLRSKANDIAYIMYTSGSTGKPKAVSIRHKSIARLVMGVNYVNLDDSITTMHFAAVSFDAATFEIWGALLNGGTCIIYDSEFFTLHLFDRIIKKYNVSTMFITASLFNTIMEIEPKVLENLKELIIGGEALSVKHIALALKLLKNTKLINGYGPTECTTFAVTKKIENIHDHLPLIPIGRPISNTKAFILDENLELLPPGIVGELFLGGDGIAAGYFNNIELTQSKFINNLSFLNPNEYLYQTGDFALYLSTGEIYCIGRKDNQIKIRGFRIELEEIELALSTHPKILRSCVLVKTGLNFEKELHAYFISHEMEYVDKSEVKDYLIKKLPSYMIPNYLHQIENFPITKNGKIDKEKLLIINRGKITEK